MQAGISRLSCFLRMTRQLPPNDDLGSAVLAEMVTVARKTVNDGKAETCGAGVQAGSPASRKGKA
jgi:hypothetical protein